MVLGEIKHKVLLVSNQLVKSKLKLCTAESCTGGMLASAFTDLNGASEVFERGYVTYSNQSKIDLLTVPTFYIEDYGAVSYETACAMAEGALLNSRADIAIAITGIAGPSGGTEEKPVGTVFIAAMFRDKQVKCKKFHFLGDRAQVRLLAVDAALDLLSELLS